MQKTDKILLGTLVPVIVAIVAVAVALWLTSHRCDEGEVWSAESRACRQKCPGEGREHGQVYDALTGRCACPTPVAPTWSVADQQCVGVCDPGTVWSANRQSCVTTDADPCTPAPSVNASTGVIENDTHFALLDGSGQCGPGSAAQKDQLCRVSECTAPQCATGERWDGFKDAACVKQLKCSLQPCDAPYCQSATLVSAVGTVYKVGDGTACVNPSETMVGRLCTSVPGRAWRSPLCLAATPQDEVALTISNATLADGVTGTVQHQLLNGRADLSATGLMTYTYTLVPTRAQSGGTYKGSVSVRRVPSCAADFDSNVCFEFHVAARGDATAGTYLLTLTGYPAWDLTLPLYQQAQPASIDLRGEAAPALKELAVKFSQTLEGSVAKNSNLVLSKLTQLQSRLANEQSDFAQNVVPVAAELVVEAGGEEDAPLLAVCTKAYCMFEKSVPFKLVVMAWAPVAAPATCVSGDRVVRYMLRKRFASKTAPGQEEVVTLIGPTAAELQPSAAEVSSGVLSFFDLVEVNSVVTYSLGAYLVPSERSTLEFEFATCKSAVFEVVVNSGMYTNAQCRQIELPGSIPPYLFAASNGTCVADTSTQARDYYCMFEWNKQVPGGTGVALYSSNSTECKPVLRTFPSVGATNQWTEAVCNPVGGTSIPNACFTGVEQDVEVVCKNYVTLQDEPVSGRLKKSAFLGRLADLHDAFKRYNYTDLVSDDLIADDAKRQMLFDRITSCGPRSLKGEYGSARCPDGDAVCAELLDKSNCSHNTCEEWTLTSAGQEGEGDTDTYTRTRRCFAGENYRTPNSACCNGRGTYKYDSATKKHSCECPLETFGDACEHTPCADAKEFQGRRFFCSPGDADKPTGKCIATGQSSFKCECDDGYYNVAEASMRPELDCKTYDKGGAGPCQLYDEKGMHNPNCLINPYSCKCPQLCQDGEIPNLDPDPNKRVRCVPKDPYTCRRNDLGQAGSGSALVNYETGCVNACSEHLPSSLAPYKYRNPIAGNFVCDACSGGGKSCQVFEKTLEQMDGKTKGACKRCGDKYYASDARTRNVDSLAECQALDPDTRRWCAELVTSVNVYGSRFCADCCMNYCVKVDSPHHKCIDFYE